MVTPEMLRGYADTMPVELPATGCMMRAAADEIERLRAALTECRDFLKHAPVSLSSDSCMCGDPEESHGIWSGHAYTDAGQYTAQVAIDKADAALGQMNEGER